MDLMNIVSQNKFRSGLEPVPAARPVVGSAAAAVSLHGGVAGADDLSTLVWAALVPPTSGVERS